MTGQQCAGCWYSDNNPVEFVVTFEDGRQLPYCEEDTAYLIEHNERFHAAQVDAVETQEGK